MDEVSKPWPDIAELMAAGPGPLGQPFDPALLRCGRTLPPVHLLEGDYVVSRGNWYRPTYHALCCAEVDSDSSESVRFDHDAMSGEDYCPGCRDCLRYCAACVAEAVRFAEQPAAAECEPGQCGEDTSVGSAG